MASRRKDDPPEFDGAEVRTDEPTFKVGYKEASVSVKGISVFIALSVAAIVASNFYAHHLLGEIVKADTTRLETALTKMTDRNATEHNQAILSQARMSCLFTMNPEKLNRFRDRYQAGAFRQECPWVNE